MQEHIHHDGLEVQPGSPCKEEESHQPDGEIEILKNIHMAAGQDKEVGCTPW